MIKTFFAKFNSIESKTFLTVSVMIFLFSVSLFVITEYVSKKVTEIERGLFQTQAEQLMDNVYLVTLTEDVERLNQEIQLAVLQNRQISSIQVRVDQKTYQAKGFQAEDFQLEKTLNNLEFVITGQNFLKEPLAFLQWLTLIVGALSLLILWGFHKALHRFIQNPIQALARTLDFYASEDFRKNPQIQALSKTGTELDVLIDKADKIYQSKLDAIAHEVTLRRTVEKAVDTKNIFIASMVHDFRTPLVIMQGALQGLETRVPNHLISPLMIQLEEMELMVTNALDLTRIESGQKVALRPKIFVLFDLLNSVIENFQAEANAKGLYIYLRLQGEARQSVLLDDAKYKQVLRNLLSNAVKYTEQGCIEVKVVCEADVLMTQVTDTGRGISEEQADSIFVPFHRLSDDSIQGTGVGLSFCRLMLQTIGFDLNFTRLERGVRFHYHFPVQFLTNQPKASCEERHCKHAVIISADSLLVDYLTQWFQSYGFDVSYQVADVKKYSLFILHELIRVSDSYTAFNSEFPLKAVELNTCLKTAREQGARIIFMHNALKPSGGVLKMFGQGMVVNLHELKGLLQGYQDFDPLSALEIAHHPSSEFPSYLTDKRILIADDVPAYRDLVVKKLKERGFKQVYVANNGLEAVAMCFENAIEVVFMDHMMPVMSGEEACRAIKAQRPETLVIGFSAVITPALEADLSQSAMDKVYMKDFKDFDQVFEFMREFYSEVREA